MYAATALVALAAAAVQVAAIVNHPGMAAPVTAAQKAQTPAWKAGVGASLAKEREVNLTKDSPKFTHPQGGAQ